MAKKKAGAREKADQFLEAIGTAGGPIGAPGLVQFGAGDTARQVMAGNTDEYAPIRMQDMQTQVGNPNAPQGCHVIWITLISSSTSLVLPFLGMACWFLEC